MFDLSNFSNPALHFSGGKDSLACWYLLRDAGLLEAVTVYHLDAGDRCPETAAVVEEIAQQTPRFVVVRSHSKSWREQHGMPSDLVPASHTFLGRLYGMGDVAISGRFDCCWNNLMLPMHARMIADNVDCVIRGTKACDTGKVPTEGSTEFYHILLPIRDWSHEQVFDYLKSVGAPQNPVYEHFGSISAPECFSCTAWWDDRKADYLRTRHPEQYNGYRVNLQTIRQALRMHLALLDQELS